MHFRHPLAAVLVLLAVMPALAAVPPDAPLWANREWERIPDPARPGMDQITALLDAFPPRQLGLSVIQSVDPAQGDKLNGQSVMKFSSLARWGWNDYGNFHSPAVTLNGQPVTLGALRALNVLESQGDRIMGDFLWDLLAGDQVCGRLVLRCVIRDGEPTWLYARTFVVGPPGLALTSVTLSSFGGFVSLAPGAEQWVAGATAHGPAPAPGPLSLEEYWFFATHQVRGGEDISRRGSSGVFLPEELKTLEFSGRGTLRLVLPQGARSVGYAVSDLRGDPDAWIAAARADGAARRQRLAEMPWRPDMERELRLLDQEAQPLVAGLETASPVRQAWQEQRDAVAAALQTAAAADLGTEDELAFGLALQHARGVLQNLWKEAVAEFAKAGGD